MKYISTKLEIWKKEKELRNRKLNLTMADLDKNIFNWEKFVLLFLFIKRNEIWRLAKEKTVDNFKRISKSQYVLIKGCFICISKRTNIPIRRNIALNDERAFSSKIPSPALGIFRSKIYQNFTTREKKKIYRMTRYIDYAGDGARTKNTTDFSTFDKLIWLI